MAENNENKIRRRKVSSTNLKNTNNNRNTIKNSNNTKNKSKNSRNNKKESSVQDIKRKQEEKEQFELEREIYYRKKKIKRKRRLKLITRLASLCLILLVIGGICFSAFAISALQGAPKVTKELIRENYISSEVVSGDKIPDDLKHAVVAMEDRRFYNYSKGCIKQLSNFINSRRKYNRYASIKKPTYKWRQNI